MNASVLLGLGILTIPHTGKLHVETAEPEGIP